VIDFWIQEFAKREIGSFPLAEHFLSAFGNLRIAPVISERNQYRPCDFIVDPLWASSGEFDRVRYWNRILKMKLFPVGEIEGNGIVLIAEDGSVLVGSDLGLDLYGPTISEGLEGILCADRIPTSIL